jgi:hypothetical protein
VSVADVIRRASADLSTLTPDAWVKRHAHTVLEAGLRLEADRLLLVQAERALDAMGTAIDAFEDLTQLRLKTQHGVHGTRGRWSQALLVLRALRAAVDGFRTYRRVIRETVGPGAKVGALPEDSVQQLDDFLASVREGAPETPAAQAGLRQLEAAVERLKGTLADRRGGLVREILAAQAARAEAGTHQPAPATTDTNRCATIGPGGRCRLKSNHGGGCQFGVA